MLVFICLQNGRDACNWRREIWLDSAVSMSVIFCYREFVTLLLHLLTRWCLNHRENTVQTDNLAKMLYCVVLAAMRGITYI